LKPLSSPDPFAFPAAQPGKITVTVFYPDAASGKQWIQAIQRTLWEMGEGEDLDARPWRLDILLWPEMQTQALRDLSASAVVIVPADDTYATSTLFRHWASTWPSAVSGERLLLVPALGAAKSSPLVQPFILWLKNLAAEKGMEFADAEVIAETLGGESILKQENPLKPPRHPGDPNPDWQAPPEERFWGLNE
jgi:hypothetical protein